MIDRDYRKFLLLPVNVCWFNESANPVMNSFGIQRFRQSNTINENSNNYLIRRTKFTTLLIDLKSDISILRKNLHRTHREEINKVRRMMNIPGYLRITHNADIDTFVNLANQYISRTNYRKHINKKELWQYINNAMGELICIYVDNELIAGHFYILDYPNRVRVLYGYNARLFTRKFESRKISWIMKYLHWYAISEHYKKAGFSCYDFGGMDLNPNSEKYGIARFKLGFGGKISTEYDYEFATNKLIGKLYVNLSYKKEFRCKTLKKRA